MWINRSAALGGLILAMLLSGCATTGDSDASGVAEPPSVQIPADKAAAEKAAADKAAADKAGKAPAAEAKPENIRVFPGTGVFVKPAPAVTPPGAPQGEDIVFNFDGADIREVAKTILVDILHESYIIDPKVGGTVNVHTSRAIKRGDLLPTLETVLRMNGAALVKESDGLYRILPSANAAKGLLTPQLGDINKPLPSGFSVQLVPLKYVGVREMAKILEPFAPETGAIRADELRNMLILAGGEKELRHLMETIDIFDVDWMSGMSVGLFTLHSTDVKTLYSEIEKLFGDKTMNPLAGVVRLVPIERLNALLVVTPQREYLEQARLWVERLDRVGGSDGGTRLFVYPVQNGKAERLATLLGSIFSKQGATGGKATPAASVAPGLTPTEIASDVSAPVSSTGASAAASQKASPITSTAAAGDTQFSSADGSLRVIADKDNNALVIMTTPDQYEKIESALRKLDVAQRQVLIEVTIAEVTLTGDMKYGVEWFFTNGARLGGQLDIGDSGIAALAPGFSYTWKDSAGSIKAVLNALAADSKLNVISSPHLMVMDNQTAKIQVGDRVPAGDTQTVVGTNVVSSVQYLDTGVQLSVTPRINANGMVAMDITQEVSNATTTTTSKINSPTISKRSVHSIVAVQSGETMVLGGMITDNKSRASSGLPLLSEIPVMGALFGSQTIVDNRTELLVMITPRVVGNPQQSREVTAEIRDRMEGLKNMELKSVIGPRSEAKSKEWLNK